MTDNSDRIYVLVTVALSEGVYTHPDDANEDGTDAIAGAYGFDIDAAFAQCPQVQAGKDGAIETALDLFHDDVGIKVLDNYEITAKRLASKDEAPETTSWR